MSDKIGITSKEMFLVMMRLKLDRILGENHPFDLKILSAGKNAVSGENDYSFLDIINEDTGNSLDFLVLSPKFKFDRLIDKDQFEDLVRRACRIYALLEERKAESSFVSPKNQLKPFLTPRQELGLDV